MWGQWSAYVAVLEEEAGTRDVMESDPQQVRPHHHAHDASQDAANASGRTSGASKACIVNAGRWRTSSVRRSVSVSSSQSDFGSEAERDEHLASPSTVELWPVWT